MQNINRMEKWIVSTLTVLLCLVLTSFWMTCNLYARYTAQASGEDGARVAKFSVTEAGTLSSQIIEEEFYPGFSKTYEVDVVNNSEVTIEYVMNVKNKYKNLPLQFRMLDSAGKEITSENSENSLDYDLSKSAEISAGDSAKHSYQLEISWLIETDSEDENLQNPDYAGKVDVIEITLKAVQKD